MLEALLHVQDGERLSDLWAIYTQIHKWNRSYTVIDSGNNTNTLVACPSGSIREEINTGTVKQVTYLETVFADLLVEHGQDNNKGRTMYVWMTDLVSNCPHPVCKLLPTLVHTTLSSSLWPFITRRFNVHGQVDLIDFQSVSDREFHFLVNCIDNEINYLFSIPIVQKRAS